MAVSSPPKEFAASVVEVDMPDELRDSFMPYALSVTVARAIPDVRDGLKPVQRRILYAMNQLRLLPTSGHQKSANIVGEVMGKYHPHGDLSIYEAMVRMGQPVASMVPLVDPRGNFGGLDDKPAAYRYTEARLSEPAMSMLDGIDEGTVDFADSYDGRRSEPTVLPAGIPNLLVNGAWGVAVGLSTSIPPHNLDEVMRAVRMWLKAPEDKPPTLSRLMRALPGPDFPSGGILTGDIKTAYATGKSATGKDALRLRARCRVEKATSRRRQLVFDELPYRIGALKVVEAIRQASESDRVKGIADAADTSSSTGAQVTVVLNVGSDPDQVRDELFAATPLEDTVSVNAVALVDGIPRVLGLREMIAEYSKHLLDVTLRRAKHVRGIALKKSHELRGLLAAVVRIEDVIAAIRAADSTAAERESLMQLLGIDAEQANAVLEMPVRRLSALGEANLRDGLSAQEAIIVSRTEVIEDDQKLRAEVIANLEAAVKPAVAARRTVIE